MSKTPLSTQLLQAQNLIEELQGKNTGLETEIVKLKTEKGFR